MKGMCTETGEGDQSRGATRLCGRRGHRARAPGSREGDQNRNGDRITRNQGVPLGWDGGDDWKRDKMG